jgi:diguanylate cyclase (GGDEF)-like protein
MGVFKGVMSANKGLRYKLLLAFALMSIIPLLACVYVISTYVFPQLDSLVTVSLIVFIAIVISLLGLILARNLVDPVVEMAIEANIIANGQYDRSLNVPTDDEVGEIAFSINIMTQKIKTNLDELKSYGQKMKEINTDVHKKVLALSSLLQIGDVISSGSIQLDPILEMSVEKATMLFDSSFGILYLAKDGESDFLARIECGHDAGELKNLVIKRSGQDFLYKTLESRTVLAIDSDTKLGREAEAFRAAYNVKSLLAVPIYSGRKNFGMLALGTKADNYKYRSEDIELVKVFAKQITIAIENDILNRKTEELAIKDELTDLYNKNFLLNRLGEEIKRAVFYQRPCSLILFGIDDFDNFRSLYGELAAEDALKKMAKVIKDNINPVGKAARVGGDEFAVLLPEKNKKESFYIAEEIKKKITTVNFLRSGNVALTVSGSVSENPLDGATADELFKKAADLLKEARSSGKNRMII